MVHKVVNTPTHPLHTQQTADVIIYWIWLDVNRRLTVDHQAPLKSLQYIRRYIQIIVWCYNFSRSNSTIGSLLSNTFSSDDTERVWDFQSVGTAFTADSVSLLLSIYSIISECTPWCNYSTVSSGRSVAPSSLSPRGSSLPAQDMRCHGEKNRDWSTRCNVTYRPGVGLLDSSLQSSVHRVRYQEQLYTHTHTHIYIYIYCETASTTAHSTRRFRTV